MDAPEDVEMTAAAAENTEMATAEADSRIDLPTEEGVKVEESEGPAQLGNLSSQDVEAKEEANMIADEILLTHGGKPGEAVIDSGATATILTSDLAEALCRRISQRSGDK